MKAPKWIHDKIDEVFGIDGFVGNFMVNIFKGGCSNVKVSETILPPKKEVDKP